MLMAVVLLPTIADPPLASWLSTRAIGIGDRVLIENNQVFAARQFAAGDTILELQRKACLTAESAYADREMGRDLQSIAAKVGPGFEMVAIAAYLAAERVRNFQAESWYAGSVAEQVGVAGARRQSAWSPLTLAHWEAQTASPSSIDPDLGPLVQQGMELVMPLLDLAARRAWVPGVPPAPPTFSDEWVRAAATDDYAGWTREELGSVLAASFARTLSHAWPTPPPQFERGYELGAEPAQRWGYAADSPTGPALLPPLQGLFSDIGISGSNAAVGVPAAPSAGSLGEGLSVRCIATRPIGIGEQVVLQTKS